MDHRRYTFRILVLNGADAGDIDSCAMLCRDDSNCKSFVYRAEAGSISARCLLQAAATSKLGVKQKFLWQRRYNNYGKKAACQRAPTPAPTLEPAGCSDSSVLCCFTDPTPGFPNVYVR